MSTHRWIRIPIGAAVAVAVSVVGGASASAHVSIAEPEHVAGEFTLLTFGVPHGCDGSPTTEVRIQMPGTIPTVTPTVNPNWDVEKVMEQLDEPLEIGHGEQITERVAEVVYTAKTPLPDGYRDAFELSLQVPEDLAGETVYFPTIQTCREGETAWIEIPEAGQDGEELELPAPSIAVVAATDDDDSAGTVAPTTPSTIPATTVVAPGTTVAGAVTTAPADGATDDADDDDNGNNGISIAALAIGVAGLGVGGTALARQRRS